MSPGRARTCPAASFGPKTIRHRRQQWRRRPPRILAAPQQIRHTLLKNRIRDHHARQTTLHRPFAVSGDVLAILPVDRRKPPMTRGQLRIESERCRPSGRRGVGGVARPTAGSLAGLPGPVAPPRRGAGGGFLTAHGASQDTTAGTVSVFSSSTRSTIGEPPIWMFTSGLIWYLCRFTCSSKWRVTRRTPDTLECPPKRACSTRA